MFRGRSRLPGLPVDWAVDSRVKIAVEPAVDTIRQMQLAHAIPLALVLCQEILFTPKQHTYVFAPSSRASSASFSRTL